MKVGSTRIYDVALSFAGEDRPFVQAVAQALQENGAVVFYDEFEKAELWGKDLYEHLSDLYMNRARFCVIFMSEHYARKPWPRLERRAAQAKSFQMLSEYILPVRLDTTEIPGILPTTGYVPGSTPEQVAQFILAKLRGPVPDVSQLDPDQLVWDWGDWLPYAGEFISQNPVKGDDLQGIMRRTGIEPPNFVGHSVQAEVSLDVAERYCALLGGRLPSREGLEYLSQLAPPVLRAAAFERGWCAYEWTRSVSAREPGRYAIQMVHAGGDKFRYFDTVIAFPEASIGFRVALLRPPKVTDRKQDRRAGKQSASRLSQCAGHAQQLGGESPLPNLMEVKG